MVFLESVARPLLMAHAVLGAATVAVASHLVVWTRGFWRGDFRRAAGVRWFATVGLGLYGAQFLLGNLLYPTYKVRVRIEYLENPEALRQQVRLSEEAARIVRLFDLKEHLTALGLALAAAGCALVWCWRPERDGPDLGRPIAFLALGIAASAWMGGLVGLCTTAWRAVP